MGIQSEYRALSYHRAPSHICQNFKKKKKKGNPLMDIFFFLQCFHLVVLLFFHHEKTGEAHLNTFQLLQDDTYKTDDWCPQFSNLTAQTVKEDHSFAWKPTYHVIMSEPLNIISVIIRPPCCKKFQPGKCLELSAWIHFWSCLSLTEADCLLLTLCSGMLFNVPLAFFHFVRLNRHQYVLIFYIQPQPWTLHWVSKCQGMAPLLLMNTP